MGEKKRKSGSQESERPSKKANTARVKVTHLAGPDVAKPVVASSPGVTLPSDIDFHPFSKRNQSGTSSLLLQSSDHPTIDYVATESKTTEAGEKHVKHYVAVFDPKTNKLQVMEAKRMTVRSSVRQFETEPDSDEEEGEETKPPPTPSSRAALTHAFGTKKSKKAVAAVAENRLLARDDENLDNPISSAILSAIKEEEDDKAGILETEAASRVNKPLPQADVSASDISDVYALGALVFPAPPTTTLSQMSIKEWLDRAKQGKPINSHYRYVAHRVGYLTKTVLKDPESKDARQKLQVLRYIELLLEMHTFVSRRPGRRPLPPIEQWTTSQAGGKALGTASLSTTFQSRIVSHFFPTNIPTAASKTLLTTTILALTLHVPPPKFQPGAAPTVLATDPSDIQLDLALPQVEVSKLFRELGCKLESATDAELTRWGLDKVVSKGVDDEGNEVRLPKPKFAKLRFPIEFPKISMGRPSRR